MAWDWGGGKAEVCRGGRAPEVGMGGGIGAGAKTHIGNGGAKRNEVERKYGLAEEEEEKGGRGSDEAPGHAGRAWNRGGGKGGWGGGDLAGAWLHKGLRLP